ncbi:GTPase [Methylobacter sp.]|uniref:GTPase n=1 Tax=Methylobacter sp. TaxID=2051955 RepID=UPI00121BEC9C|nr:GTPase [Methylobacter sp.]TAK61077.1 MAG: GTP-binding protein [Methylobacter sp.]
MAYDYSSLVEKTKHWAKQAAAAGWINADAAQQLSDVDTRAPDTLFNHDGSRPLIVAFMGGTGVGKSSLLNRLAGKAIARAGVERPTSREVTLYHHHSVSIKHLPEQLPLAQIKIAEHDNESRKSVIWIDMPDFDSTEQSNKHQVLEWLPHIDVLIYVVSPERYRDEKAWRLLLSEGGRHAWLFVLNQWDRGQTEQYEDFKKQLHKAGFADPVIFKTVCGESLQSDEFAALESTISSLATEHIVAQLEQRSSQLKRDELKQNLQNARQSLGSASTFQRLPTLWQDQWQRTSYVLQQGFAWPIQQLARHYADHAADLMGNPATAKYSATGVKLNLWDDWAEARFSDALDEFVINADQLGVPVNPLKTELSALRDKAPKIVQAQSELAARQALANPGNALHRGFLKFMRLCEIILPLAAICWVGYQVFIGYYTSNMTEVEYLGVDFAIHSSLLIAITWLTPFFILKKLKPSLEKSALRGLNKGLNSAINMIDAEVQMTIENIGKQHAEQIKQLDGIIELCGAAERQPSIDSNSPLARMLID